ncbi:MAG: hypothetical protein QHH15_06145 [Candidatus Thermoplasmatota archaeon]|nr:hypothetical protein [Candidatus Thermoplasmatota archaeon]
MKISELNDKCQKIDQMILMEKSKIELLEQRVGGLKELIKKLEDLDKFKENQLKQIKDENKEIMEKEINNISKKIADEIELIVKNKIKDIEKTMKYLTDREKEIKQQNMIIQQMDEKISYLLKHNELLMMKLANKAILSYKEIDEMDLRASKKQL